MTATNKAYMAVLFKVNNYVFYKQKPPDLVASLQRKPVVFSLFSNLLFARLRRFFCFILFNYIGRS